MKIRKAIIAGFLSVLAANTYLLGAEIGYIPISEAIASTTSEPDNPGFYAADGDENTKWRCSADSLSGRLELRFDDAFALYGLEIAGSFDTETRLRAAYINQEGEERLFSGGFLDIQNSLGTIDLSYDRATGTVFVLSMDNPGLSEIREVRVIGTKAKELLSIIEPVSIEVDETTSPNYPETFLFDGNPWTEWKTERSYTHGSIPHEVWNKFEGWSHSRGKKTHGYGSIEAIARLGTPHRLDSVRIYVSNELNGFASVEIGLAGNWTALGWLNSYSFEGWYEFAATDMTADSVRIVRSGDYSGRYGGIGEIEIRGKDGYKGDQYTVIGDVTKRILEKPVNFSFHRKADGLGATLEIGMAKGIEGNLSIDLNGYTHELNSSIVQGLSRIYTYEVPSHELWDGENFLRIRPRGASDELYFTRIRNRRNLEPIALTNREGVNDGKLLTPADSPEELELTLDGASKLRSIEVYSSNGIFPELQVKIPVWKGWRWNYEWTAVPISFIDGMRGLYKTDMELDKFKIIKNGSIINEVRVSGSRSRDRAPLVSLVSPDLSANAIPRLGSDEYFIGFVDNPSASIVVNGRLVSSQGHYFWATPRNFNAPKDEVLTITATATDKKGRKGTCTASLFVGESDLFNVDQTDTIHYSMDKEWEVSGAIKYSGVAVRINDEDAVIKGRKFSGYAHLEEGLNLVAISLVKKASRWERERTLAVVYRKVVLLSEPLQLTITSPMEASYTRNESITVQGMVQGIGALTITADGTPCTVRGSEFTSTPIQLVEGLNELPISVTDAIGRQAALTLRVYKDTIPPQVVIEKPLDDSYLAESEIIISGILEDASPLTVYVNKTAITHGIDGYTTSWLYKDGVRTAQVRVVDAAGNSNETSTQFTVDTVPPLDFATQAEPGGWTNNTNPILSFHTSDATSGVAYYEVSVDGLTWERAVSPYVLPTLSDGQLTIFIRAVDRSGNTTYSTTQVYIDTTAPPAPGSFVVTPGNKFMFLAWEKPSTDTTRYEIVRTPSFPNGMVIVTDTEYYDQGTITGTPYTYSIVAVDRAENFSQKSEGDGIGGIALEPYDPSEDYEIDFYRVKVEIPADTLTDAVSKIAVFELESERLTEAATNPLVGPIYDISAVTSINGIDQIMEGISFDTDVLVKINFDEEMLPSEASEETLRVFYFDSMWSKWFLVKDSSVDLENNTVFFTTDHFTSFSIQATPVEDLSPQELRSIPYSPSSSTVKHERLNVSPQGGGVSTAMIELVLPGPEGFDFALRRTYDTATARRDSRILGLIANTMDDRNITLETYESMKKQIEENNLDSKAKYVDKQIKNTRKAHGDYAYSMGLGWRLDLPYVRYSNEEYILHSPSGGEYSFKSNLEKKATITVGSDRREIKFECHSDEDFTLYAQQKGESGSFLIWSWTDWDTTGWRLVMKDGTSYHFSENGSLASITDPSGNFSITFAYDRNKLSKITDSRGRTLSFTYEEGFGVPYIATISANGIGTIQYYRHSQYGTLSRASDMAGRIFSYEYADPFFLKTLLIKDLDKDEKTQDKNASTEYVSLLESIEGPGIGSEKVAYKEERLEDDEAKTTSCRLSASTLTLSTAEELIKESSYSYQFTFQGDNQFICSSAEVTDGRTIKKYAYEGKEKSRYPESGSNGTTTYHMEYIAQLRSVKTTDQNTGMAIEEKRMEYDPTSFRKTKEELFRFNGQMEIAKKRTEYAYDAWGNVSLERRTTMGTADTVLEIRSDYLNGGSSQAPVRTSSDVQFPSEINQVPPDIHSLLSARREISTLGGSVNGQAYYYNEYDSKGRLSKKALYRDGAWRSSTYSYDPSWHEISSIINPDGHESSFSYSQDSVYRTVTRTEKNVLQGDDTRHDIISTSAFSRNTGLMVSQTDGRIFTTTWEYDPLGRIKKTIKPKDAGETGNPIISCVYDDSASPLTVTITDGEANTTEYRFDTLGRMKGIVKTLRTRDSYGLLTGGTSTVISTSIDYDAWDQIVSITDPRNFTTSYSYDAMGRLSRIDNPDATYRTMVYDYYTDTLTITDERRNSYVETYNVRGDLLERVRFDSEGKQIVEAYSYDAFGRVLEHINKFDGKTDRTKFQYDESGNLIHKMLPQGVFFEDDRELILSPTVTYGYDAAGSLASETADGPDGGIRKDYTNDGLGRRIKTEQSYYTYEGDAKVHSTKTTQTAYDDSGNVEWRMDGNGKYTRFTYSARGMLTSEQTPGGSVTRYGYDKNDRLILSTDPRGASLGDTTFSVDYRYDDAGRLLAGLLPDQEGQRPSIRFTYDARGNLTKRTERDGGITDYEYDNRNRLIQTTVTATLSDGSVRQYITEYGYDEAGNQTSVIDGLGAESVQGYDALGRLISFRNPKYETSSYTYDGYGNTESITDALNHTTRMTYDPFGKILRHTDPEEGTTRYFYDRFGRMTKMTDPLGNETVYEYDERSLLLKEKRANGVEYHYSYDPADAMITARDPRETETVYEYDEDYRLKAMTRTNGTEIETLDYTYDEAGSMKTAANDSTTIFYNTPQSNYQPDAYGRIRNLKRTIDGRTFETGYDYDLAGRATEITYPDGREIAFKYDTSGRLETIPGYIDTPITYDLAGRIDSLTMANTVTLTTDRDALGRLTYFSYKGQETIASYRLRYDEAGNIAEKNESSYEYDKANRLLGAFEEGRYGLEKSAAGTQLGRIDSDYYGQESLSFTAEEAEVFFDYSSMSIGVDLGKTYEVARIILDPQRTGHRVKPGRFEIRVSLQNGNHDWTKLEDLEYVEYPDGSIEARLRKPVEARYVKLHCYYDDLGEDGQPVDKATVRKPLVTIKYLASEREEEYQYDPKGNRKRVTTTFDGNRIERSYTYWPGTDWVKTDGRYGYTYDANGNLTEKGTAYTENADGTLAYSATEGDYVRYEYDLANRLKAVYRSESGTVTATLRASYRYGPDDLRICKTTTDGSTYYIYDLTGNLLYQETSLEKIETIWAFGKKLAEVETSVDTETGTTVETRTFLATDHLGSVIAASDETGRLIWQGDFSAFAEAGGEVGLVNRTRSYTGKDLDEESGLYYFNARWYDASLGRFTSEDPAKDGVNWYTYCGSNPLRWVDPSGMWHYEGGELVPDNEDERKEYLDKNKPYSSGDDSPSGESESGKDGKKLTKKDLEQSRKELVDILGQESLGEKLVSLLNGDFGKDRMDLALLYIQDAVTNGSVYSAAAAIAEMLNATAECALDLVVAREIAAAIGFYALYFQAEAAGKRVTLPNATLGWKVGDPINNLTSKGNVPSWSTVRARFWKNEAVGNSGTYSPANIKRMQQGLAPQRINPTTGRVESMELHHTPPQRDGGLFDVQKVWPDEHAALDPFRVTWN